MIVTRDRITEIAKSYLGVNFRMYGRDRTGVDCVGLLYCIGKELGMELHNDRDYSRRPEPKKMEAVLDMYTDPAPYGIPRNGQVLKLRQFIFPMHFGVVLIENNQKFVINANIKKKQVTMDAWSMWENLILEYREIKGVT